MPDNLLHPTPEIKNVFWNIVELPFQDEDTELQFTNPVVTAEWFAKLTHTIADLGGKAETLEEEIANLKVHLRRAESDLSRFRRTILADSYSKITKSADKIVQDAFVLLMSKELGRDKELSTLENDVEDLRQQIEVREPRKDQLYTRLKILKDSEDAAKQYLDHEKLQMRMTQRGF